MSDKLLNTAEAARFLRVSQASVRRWSDSGLLPARRVGRRGERRFTEADLKRFLAPASSAPKNAPDGVQSEVFIGGVAIPAHAHIATFYDSDEGRLRLTIPFLREGLKSRQPCFLVAEGDTLTAYLRALGAEDGIDVDFAIRHGRLTTAPRPGSSVEGALRFLEQSFSRALTDGPTLVRLVGEMSSARKGFPSDPVMIEFEVGFNTIAKRLPSVSICQYDVRVFDGETIFQAIKAHPDLYSFGIATFLN